MKVLQISAILLSLSLLTSCDFIRGLNEQARMAKEHEIAALNLARENRDLRGQITTLKYETQSLKSKINFLTIQLNAQKEKKKEVEKMEEPSKKSIMAMDMGDIKSQSDLVQWDVYHWKPSQLHNAAKKFFKEEKWEEAAQFFKSVYDHYPKNEIINDQFFFHAGLASYKTKKHYKWAENFFSALIDKYPDSSFFRPAKLFLGFTYLHSGQERKFKKIVIEFKRKYLNTDEGKFILSYDKDIKKIMDRN